MNLLRGGPGHLSLPQHLFWLVLACLAALCALSAPAQAVPRFALQNGAPCSLCHVNPTGGGLRNDFGRDVFSRRRLSLEWPRKAPREGDRALLGLEALSVGGDLRLAYLYQSDSEQDLDTDPDLDALFLMQTDLYLSAKTSSGASLYADIGLRGGFEAFALYENLPADLYLKAGAFTPPFGLKLPDHTAITRFDLGFDPGVVDTGVELGSTGDKHGGSLLFSAGQLSRDAGLGNGLLFQGSYAVSGYAYYILRDEPLRVFVLASAAYDGDQAQARTRLLAQNTLRTEAGAELDPEDIERFRELKLGGALGLAAGRLWYLAELDLVRNPIELLAPVAQALGDDRPLSPTGYLSRQELGISLVQGLDLYAAFDFHDPDATLKADPARPAPTDPVLRSGLYVELFPADNIELSAFVRYNSATLAGLVPGSTDAVVMLHLFY